MSEIHWLIFMFGTGILIRLVDRMDHASAGPDKTVPTWLAYLQQNWIRLVVRILTAVAVFVILRENGELNTKLSALLGGYGLDTAIDSLLQRKDRMSKNGNGTAPAATVLLLCVALGTAGMAGCAARSASTSSPQPTGKYAWYQVARDVLVGEGAFLKRAQQNHLADCQSSCTLPSIKDPKLCVTLCNSINGAIDLHRKSKAAMDLFCDGPGWMTNTAPCRPQSAHEMAARAAYLVFIESLELFNVKAAEKKP